MQPNDSNTLDAAQLAKFPPETIAAAVAKFSQESANGDLTGTIAREALLDLWQQYRGLDNRAQTVTDLCEIEVNRHARAKG